MKRSASKCPPAKPDLYRLPAVGTPVYDAEGDRGVVIGHAWCCGDHGHDGHQVVGCWVRYPGGMEHRVPVGKVLACDPLAMPQAGRA